MTVAHARWTVEQFYENHTVDTRAADELLLDTDLKDIFNVSPRKRKGVKLNQLYCCAVWPSFTVSGWYLCTVKKSREMTCPSWVAVARYSPGAKYAG